LLGYALVVAEEVTSGSAVVHFVELVDVVGELTGGVLFLDSLAVGVVPVFFDKRAVG
jgi:hypothetical protein